MVRLLLSTLGVSVLVAACGSEARRSGGGDDDGSTTGSPTGQSSLSGGSNLGGGCANLCQESSQCPGGQPNADCAADCDKLDDFAAKSSCGDEVDGLLDCANDLSDVCTLADGECKPELEAYVDCFTAFCMANPNDAFCGG